MAQTERHLRLSGLPNDVLDPFDERGQFQSVPEPH